MNKQKKIQKRVNSLLRHLDRYDDYKEEILEKLTDLSEELDDSHLAKISAGMDFEANDLGKSVAEQALSYVTENYRIERKVIRNRRDFVNEKLASRVLIECGYEMQSEEVGYSERNTYYAVLQYISMLLENGDAELGIVKQLLQAMFSSPWALMDVISKNEVDDTGLISSLNLWLSQSEDEIKSADYYLDENPDEIKGRLLKAVDFIEQEIGVNDYSEGKIVVFSEFEETLSKLESILRGRSIRCVRFVSSMSKDELEESVYLFQNEQDCRIILCDATGGEGRNFQNADWLIHIDLPWTANSIEQRIGRLDRLGRETGHMEVKSVVFYALDSIEAQLFEIWNSGLSLFEKSLSGLEIITGELNERIDNAICSDVYNGLQNALEDIINMTEEASEAVEEEQLYDSGNIIYRPLSKAVDNMLKTYQCGETNLFQSAMLGWSTQAGLKSSKTKHEGVIQFGQENFSPMAAIQSLLIPPNWKKYEDTPIMRREGRILGTFDRGIAIKREDVLFFAPGDPVFESIIGNAVDSGRGRCSAFEIENAPFKCRGFVCIYNVEPDVNYLYEHGISTQLLSQFRMYLPMEQIFSFVATNEESKAVPEEDIISILKEKSIVLNANHLGSRKVKKDGYSPVEKFMLANPEEKWREYVKKVGKVARRKATEKALAQSDFEAARREITRIVNGYESECLYLDKDMSQVEVIRDKYEKVYHALSNPVLTLDSIAYIRIG